MPHRTDQQPQQPTPTPGDLYVAAARRHHLTHCADCRERTAASDAAAAENGASIQRRDRLTLGLRAARATAVTA